MTVDRPLSKSGEKARRVRAARVAAGLPATTPRAERGLGPSRRLLVKIGPPVDPMDYSHPLSDVRLGP